MKIIPHGWEACRLCGRRRSVSRIILFFFSSWARSCFCSSIPFRFPFLSSFSVFLFLLLLCLLLVFSSSAFLPHPFLLFFCCSYPLSSSSPATFFGLFPFHSFSCAHPPLFLHASSFHLCLPFLSSCPFPLRLLPLWSPPPVLFSVFFSYRFLFLFIFFLFHPSSFSPLLLFPSTFLMFLTSSCPFPLLFLCSSSVLPLISCAHLFVQVFTELRFGCHMGHRAQLM